MNLLKKLFQRLSKWYEKKSLNKYYTSIEEIPMLNWIRVYEKQDYKGLLKSKGNPDRYAHTAYQKLQDQILDAFGISEDFLKILKKKIRIETMYAQQFATGNKSNQILIDIAELELSDLEKVQPQKVDIQESLMFIEKQMGFRIPLHEITVYQFYTYSNFLSKRLK